MANEVYANGMEVACKAAEGKTVAAMPDVCLSPPSPPAGPIPIPYPNTAYASDTTDGSKTVQISGQEVVLKDKSTFKKSTGDEAATKSLGMGVVSHQIQGEINFASWSMDVKIEGENAARHLDLTLHNEMCIPANTPTWPYLDRMAMSKGLDNCSDNRNAVTTSCERDKKGKVTCPKKGKMNLQQYAMAIENDPCQRAARCLLSPKSPSRCCKPQTPHHLLPKAGFFKDKFGGKPMRKFKPGYNQAKAPCVCCEGHSYYAATHGLVHDSQVTAFNQKFKNAKTWKCSDALDNAASAVKKIFDQCNEQCIRDQLKREHETMGIKEDDDLRVIKSKPEDISQFRAAFEKVQKAIAKLGPGTTR